jgi:hypothetical protein
MLAVNGLDSPGLLKLLHNAPSARFEVVVLPKGANDATGVGADPNLSHPPDEYTAEVRAAIERPVFCALVRWLQV